MTNFLIGLAVGSGFTMLVARHSKKREALKERTQNNIERASRNLQELEKQVHQSEQLLKETEKKVHRVHRQARNPRRRRQLS